MAPARRLIAIVGPTASGKSAAALRLAADTSAEIVSCDSLQVFRGLDVGSAKPTAQERAAVPHHMLDLRDPDEDFSAADYARLGRDVLAGIAERRRPAIVVGGTGLYLRALLRGIFPGPARDDAFRARLEAVAARGGEGRLRRWLARVDPAAEERIAPRDRVRLVRALEVWHATGRALSAHHRDGAHEGIAGWEVMVLVLDLGQDALRPAVVARTDRMMRDGLIEEARALLARHPDQPRPLRAIGYAQACAVVQGTLTADAARRDMVEKTMRYAKRQRTWFRHQESATWCASADEVQARGRLWLGGA